VIAAKSGKGGVWGNCPTKKKGGGGDRPGGIGVTGKKKGEMGRGLGKKNERRFREIQARPKSKLAKNGIWGEDRKTGPGSFHLKLKGVGSMARPALKEHAQTTVFAQRGNERGPTSGWPHR